MEPAVTAELETLLGFMQACQATVASIEAEQLPGPELPSPADYVRRMTWAQAAGALRILEQLKLITHAEREAWEQQAQTLVARAAASPVRCLHRPGRRVTGDGGDAPRAGA